MINGLRWAHETEDEGDDDDEGGAKAKKKLSSKKRGQKAKAKSSHKGSKSLYKAGDFAKARKQFLQEIRKDGMAYKDAQLAWTNSKQRADLLSGMSEGELKRRRFI